MDFIAVGWYLQRHRTGLVEGSSLLSNKYELWWILVKSWRSQRNDLYTLIGGTVGPRRAATCREILFKS